MRNGLCCWQTLLSEAAKGLHDEVLEWCIKHGSIVNDDDFTGTTALGHAAIAQGQARRPSGTKCLQVRGPAPRYAVRRVCAPSHSSPNNCSY